MTPRTRLDLAGWVMALVLAAGSALAAAADAPLANAVQQMDRETIRHLLERRTDVNVSKADGVTALHWAAFHDDSDLVDRLLRAGANPRAANRYGVTPLSLACTNGNEAMVTRLLDAGADANYSLPGGET